MRERSSDLPAGVPRTAGLRLDFSMQKQIKTQLCWAAVAASIDNYYRDDPVNQRTLIGKAERNEPRSTADMLDRLGRLQRVQDGPVAFDVIHREISQRRPIVAGIGLAGSRHVVVIVGCDLIGSQEHIRVSDPKSGAVRLWDYRQFKENRCFRWQSTLFTK